MEPPPSVACAAGTSPAATAAADPPEEPPPLRFRSQGLGVGPCATGSVVAQSPNSGVLVLAIQTRPALFWRVTISPSLSGMKSAKNWLPFCIGTPAYGQFRSFSMKGTPVKGPSGRPSAMACLASASISVTTTLSSGCSARMRSSASSSSSSVVTSPLLTSSARPTASYLPYSLKAAIRTFPFSPLPIAFPRPSPGIS